jgi:pterin-4a-carbinolamine dehydratase
MIQPSRFHEVGWRVIQHTAATRFRTDSLAQGVGQAQAISGLAGAGDRPHLDLRPDGVTVRLVADDRSVLTEDDLTLAAGISAIASDLDIAADPAGVQNVEGRIAAAIEAGGRIVYDGHAPLWWTLADPEGNEVDVAPWPDLDEPEEG